MKKAIVLTADKFEDMEVYVPIFRLMEEGWQVDVAAPKKEVRVKENIKAGGTINVSIEVIT